MTNITGVVHGGTKMNKLLHAAHLGQFNKLLAMKDEPDNGA
jgi:hypothetical protein